VRQELIIMICGTVRLAASVPGGRRRRKKENQQQARGKIRKQNRDGNKRRRISIPKDAVYVNVIQPPDGIRKNHAACQRPAPLFES